MNYEIISSGKGIKTINVCKSTLNDIIEEFGNNYNAISYYKSGTSNKIKYSTEISYTKIGLKFFILEYNILHGKMIENTKKEISYILIMTPFKCKTKKNIILGESIMKDVLNQFGCLNWVTSSGSFSGDFWISQQNGIDFYVKKDKSIIEFPINQEFYLKKTIVGIGIKEKLSIKEYNELLDWNNNPDNYK